MVVRERINQSQISSFLETVVFGQSNFEQSITRSERKKNGVFLTNSLATVENVLNIVEINPDILNKRILEPSCGQGIFILKLISDVYQVFPDEQVISKFISANIYFVDIQKEMVDKTISNIKALYGFLFDESYEGSFNGITWDFTEKASKRISLFDEPVLTPFSELYESFDYVIGNPPYVTLYGRRDKKQSEAQRVNYLKNYNQFPDSIKNGKLNLVMLFIEHSLDFLKKEGKLAFIIDVSFFETAYEFTRKYLLEKTRIEELQVNIKDFDVASGQVVLKVTKTNEQTGNLVKIIDWKTQSTYTAPQATWLNKIDGYKFRYNRCGTSKLIIDKINSKRDKTLLQLYPNKNLRTCVMLLDMEDKFTLPELRSAAGTPVYPYYQGSKALSEKYGNLAFGKYFYYDKPLQDSINDELKIQLEKEGIKNKKRLGLGETVVYDNPKIYIRQSAKEIVATVDLKKSSANNSLYVFSLRNNYPDTIDFLYFLCGLFNSDLVTYFSQQMNIIRYSHGKQPQIKIGDLGTIFVPADKKLQKEVSDLCKGIYENRYLKNELSGRINTFIYDYYKLTAAEIEHINTSIKAY